MIEYIIIAIVIILILIFVYYFNRLNVLSNTIDNSWAQIDVQLKKRTDLVPNLVETVKGYAAHEKSIFEDVANARAQMMGAQTVEEKDQAGNMLAKTLKSLFAIAENYPELKASQNFLMLQEELSGIENKIAYARQHYNDTVLVFNNLVTTLPGSIFAGILGKKGRPYLEISAAEREPVKVKF
ncbi:MAG: LemA family protein [Bacteroidota bacterium]|nr:LemA family protein [Bacteroidota bacterium]MDP4197518.1 LemA family protein [Bacteroidota bacterium]